MLVVFSLILSAHAAALEIEGHYRIEQDGELIGAESYTVTFGQDGEIKTTSTGTTRHDDTSIESLTEAQYRKNGEIKDYQREVYINKVPQKLIAVNQGPDLKINLKSGPTKMEREVPIHYNTVIVDVGTFHHYYLLINRYSKKAKGKQPFWAVIPSETREVKATVELLEHTSTQMEFGYFEGDKFFINMGDVGIILWVDERSRIFKIEIPMQGFSITEKGYKGKRAQVIPSPVKSTGMLFNENIYFKAKDGVKLAGKITRLKNVTGPVPGIIFMSTSGPQDRQGNNPIGNISTHTNDILDRLSNEGYLVLRYDDRGIGESGGDFSRNSLSAQASDLLGAIEFLKTRQDVDSARIAVIGHGEGANAVLHTASELKELKAVILLAPSSISLSQLAIRQVKTRLKAEGNSDPEAYTNSAVYIALSQARGGDKKFTVIGRKGVYLDIFREWDNMDPLSDIGKLTCPIFHAQGKRDVQVFPDLAEKFKNANKSTPYTFKMFDGLDHFFVASDGTVGSYTDPNRKVDKEFLNFLVKWVAANL